MEPSVDSLRIPLVTLEPLPTPLDTARQADLNIKLEQVAVLIAKIKAANIPTDKQDALIAQLQSDLAGGGNVDIGAVANQLQAAIITIEAQTETTIVNDMAFIENGQIAQARLDDFARAHHYDAAVIRNVANVFGDTKLGHEPAMLNMVGDIANHGTPADRDALAHDHDKIATAVHLMTIASGKPMMLSEMAKHLPALEAMKQAVMNDPTHTPEERTNAAHFISLYENKVRAYNEAKADGRNPPDWPVSIPDEFKDLKRENYKNEAEFEQAFMTRYQAYETRKTSQLQISADSVPDDKMGMLRKYAAEQNPPIETDPAKNPGWLFQAKQQLDIKYSTPHEVLAAYEASKKSEPLSVAQQAAIDMTVLNNMYGNPSSAAIFDATMKGMTAQQRADFFKESPADRLASVSSQLKSQVAFEDRAALQVTISSINSEADYKQFSALLAESKISKDPAKLISFTQDKMYPDMAADKNAPDFVKRLDKAVQFDGAKRLLLDKDPARFQPEVMAKNRQYDEEQALKALKESNPADYAAYLAYRKSQEVGAPVKHAEIETSPGSSLAAAGVTAGDVANPSAVIDPAHAAALAALKAGQPVPTHSAVASATGEPTPGTGIPKQQVAAGKASAALA